MDVTALLVFVGGFAVCAALVFLVSVFGVKEQTFEEALEAQRKKNEKEKNKAKDKKKDDSKKKNQRWLKKKERDERISEQHVDGDNTEEERVILDAPEEVPILEEVQAPLVEESTPEPSPQPTPEPTQLRNRKEKKIRKMEIQEVTEEVVVEEIEPVVEVEPVEPVEEPEVVVEEILLQPVHVEQSKAEPSIVKEEAPRPSPVVAKKGGKKQNQNANRGSKDLLSIVEKTVLNDFEAQQIIDVLLNKQSGNLGTGSDEWVEQGKPSETAKLTKKLEEMERALAEEVNKGQSFKDKMTELRRELNEEKSAKAAAARMIDEINNTRSQESNNLNTKLQQVQYDMTILQTQLNQQVQHSHQLELSQAHYQANIDSLNHQLEVANAAAVSASAAVSNDPNLLSELEQLRMLRDKYEAQLSDYAAKNTALGQQLSAKSEEAIQMSGEANKLAGVQKQLEQVSSSQSQLNSEVARLQAENNLLSCIRNKAETDKELMNQLEIELSDVKSKMQQRENDVNRLQDENERLSEQVASAVERPQAEGQADDQNGDVNGLGEESLMKEKDLQEKLDSLTIEHNKLIAKQTVDAGLEQDLKTKLDTLTGEHDKLIAKQKVEESYKTELEALKEKYDNVTSEHQQMIAKQNLQESQNSEEIQAIRAKTSALESELCTYKSKVEELESKNNELSCGVKSAGQESLELLSRLFPDLPTSANVADLEAEAKKQIQAMSVAGSELEKTEGQVSHYKTVLSQTESMLTCLQTSVEAEEGEWRNKLEACNKELCQLQAQNTALAAKNSSLEESMVLVKQAEEMQAKLIELQAKLACEEEEKRGLAVLKDELIEKCDDANKSASKLREQLESAQDISKEVEQLTKDLEVEKLASAKLKSDQDDLVKKNTQLSQLLMTGQQALEKETNSVKTLQEQLIKAKEDSD